MTVLALLFVAFVVYNSIARVGHECRVCIEFNGRRDCRSAAGATEEEAKLAAQTTACGLLASGMDQSIACGRAVPETVQCSGN